jgi:cytoskeleton protein RodZ
MYPMAGSPLVVTERPLYEVGLRQLKTEIPARVAPSPRFACGVCGATLDDAHLEFGPEGSQCAFCGAPQRNGHERPSAPNASLDVGDALHEARLDRGETLEQAAHFTRIQPAYLRALEHDDPGVFEPFPGLAYARFFLKDYAEHLGIDPRPLVRRFDRDTTEPVVEPTSRSLLRAAPHPSRWAVGATIVLIALLIGSALWAERSSFGHDAVSPGPWKRGHYLATGPVGPRGATDVSTAAQVQHIWVVVRTTSAPSWISATVDGSVEQGTLPPGEVRRWRADHTVDLRIGRPSAVILRVNGERIAIGNGGAPIDRTFALQNGRVVRS